MIEGVTILTGDCRTVLADLPERSVSCCITSPPYFSLRDYGTEPLVWGDGWRGQLGLEPDPRQYVAHLVECFDAVWRVLRDDGTMWVVLGDSFARDRSKGQHGPGQSGKQARVYDSGGGRASAGITLKEGGLKAKNRLFVPHRVAMALQERGWICRIDVAWEKSNALTESVKDRPSVSHEYVFLFSKRERYYFDHAAVRQPHTGKPKNAGYKGREDGRGERAGMHNHKGRAAHEDAYHPLGRNLRSVWSIPHGSYQQGHFAVMPLALVELCIKASTSEWGACAECGAPWRRVEAKGEPDREWQKASGGDGLGQYEGQAVKAYEGAKAQNASDVKRRILAGMTAKITTGWEPICRCGTTARRPCLLLDPFAGSGTVGVAAKRLRREAVLIDVKPEYVKLSEERCDPIRVEGERVGQLSLETVWKGEEVGKRPASK